MNELPIMPIRAKYADETTKGVNIDSALEEAAGDTSALEERVGDLETTVGDEDSGLVKAVDDLETTVGDEDSGLVKQVDDLETTTQQISYDGDNDLTEIHSDLTVDGDTDFEGGVIANSQVEINALLTINGDASFSGEVVFTGDVDFSNAGIIGLSVGTKLYKHALYCPTEDCTIQIISTSDSSIPFPSSSESFVPFNNGILLLYFEGQLVLSINYMANTNTFTIRNTDGTSDTFQETTWTDTVTPL